MRKMRKVRHLAASSSSRGASPNTAKIEAKTDFSEICFAGHLYFLMTYLILTDIGQCQDEDGIVLELFVFVFGNESAHYLR